MDERVNPAQKLLREAARASDEGAAGERAARPSAAQELLRKAARASDEEAAGERTARNAAQRALAAWEARGPRRAKGAARSPLRPIAALAAAAVLAAVLIAGLWRAPQEALSFVTVPAGAAEQAGEPGQVGAWLASPPGGLALRFSEGTEMVLRAGASARVARADEHGADVLLERGALDASVVHRDHATGWKVHAGPFEIRIVGTRFEATWEPVSGTLDVHVKEGRVIVAGPLLDDGRAVGSEERLRVSLQTSRFEMTRVPSTYAAATEGAPAGAGRSGGASAEPGASGAAAGPESVPGGPGAGAPGGAGPGGAEHGGAAERGGVGGAAAGAPGGAGAGGRAAASSGAGGADWRALARTGRHRAAVDAAVAQGYEGVLAGASAADLLLLADSARFAGEAGRARQALLAARGRGAKGSTAFLLGKIAADSSGAPGEAAQWFETYLAEAPSGGLAEQALGRLVEVRRRAGQTSAARAAATRYLERYPDGGYASAARAVLQP